MHGNRGGCRTVARRAAREQPRDAIRPRRRRIGRPRRMRCWPAGPALSC